MKTKISRHQNHSAGITLKFSRGVKSGLGTAIVLAGFLTSQCAEPASTWGGNNHLGRLEPGPIAITSTLQPAAFKFDPPTGKKESAAEGAANTAAAVLSTPRLGNPQIGAAVGVIEFALAPFVAGYGALKASLQRLEPEKLSETEQELSRAMGAMADQKHFRQMVIEAAREKTRRTIFELAPPEPRSRLDGPLGGVLETRVSQLRLHRCRNTDKSFRLEMKALVHLERAADGLTVYDRPFEYQSGEALFLDWARRDGFESVARTAYRAIARQVASDLFSPPSATPILLGTGQKSKGKFSNFDRPDSHSAPLTPAQHAFRSEAAILFANYQYMYAGSIEILPDLSSRQLRIQGLMEKQPPPSEEESDTEYALDGLENHPNFVLQVAACAAALPMGLWEHTVGALHKATDRTLEAADSIGRMIPSKPPPQQILAGEIADCLAPHTSETVLFRSEAWLDAENVPGPHKTAATELSLVQSVKNPPDSRLEIRVTNLALSGKRAKNPNLALCLEVEATLLRTCDGQEVCVWPVFYRGSPHRLVDWAAEDAVSLQRELSQAYRAMATAISDELISGGFVAPASVLPPAVAIK